jgi:kynurenine formamidase
MLILQNKISLEALLKAKKQLDYAIAYAKTDLEKTGSIKCFEFGTHIDFPRHIIPGGADVSSFSIENSSSLCIVMYPDHKAENDFVLTKQMLEVFENKHGIIPNNAWFLLLTGWGKKAYSQDAYQNYQGSTMHFPTIAEDAAHFLVKRGIKGFGIDTLSPDAEFSNFNVHKILLEANVVIVENVKYIPNLPPSRGFLQVVPLALTNAGECPARLIYAYR